MSKIQQILENYIKKEEEQKTKKKKEPLFTAERINEKFKKTDIYDEDFIVSLEKEYSDTLFRPENIEQHGNYIMKLDPSSFEETYLNRLYEQRVKVKRYTNNTKEQKETSVLLNGIKKGIIKLELIDDYVVGDPTSLTKYSPESGEYEHDDFDKMYTVNLRDLDSTLWDSLKFNEVWVRVVTRYNNKTYVPDNATVKYKETWSRPDRMEDVDNRVIVFYKTFREYVNSLLKALLINKKKVEKETVLNTLINERIDVLTRFLESGKEKPDKPKMSVLYNKPYQVLFLFDVKLRPQEKIIFDQYREVLQKRYLDIERVRQKKLINKFLQKKRMRYQSIYETQNILYDQCFKNKGNSLMYFRPLSTTARTRHTVYKHPTEKFIVPIKYQLGYPTLPIYPNNIELYDIEGIEFKHYLLMPPIKRLKKHKNYKLLKKITTEPEKSRYYIEVPYSTPNGSTILIREGVSRKNITTYNYLDNATMFTNKEHNEFKTKLNSIYPKDQFYTKIVLYIQKMINTTQDYQIPMIYKYVSEQIDRLIHKGILTLKKAKFTIPIQYGNFKTVMTFQDNSGMYTQIGETFPYKIQTRYDHEKKKYMKGVKVIVTDEVERILRNFQSEYPDFKMIDPLTDEIVSCLELNDIIPINKDENGIDIIDIEALTNTIENLRIHDIKAEKEDLLKLHQFNLKAALLRKTEGDNVNISTFIYNDINELPCIYFD